MAVAIVEFGVSEWKIDPSFGEVVFRANNWGFVGETGELFYNKDLISSHQCSLEELGLEGNNASFFPIHKNNRKDVKKYQK